MFPPEGSQRLTSGVGEPVEGFPCGAEIVLRISYALRECFLLGLRLLGLTSCTIRIAPHLRQFCLEFLLAMCELVDTHGCIPERPVRCGRLADHAIVRPLRFSDSPFRIPPLSARLDLIERLGDRGGVGSAPADDAVGDVCERAGGFQLPHQPSGRDGGRSGRIEEGRADGLLHRLSRRRRDALSARFGEFGGVRGEPVGEGAPVASELCESASVQIRLRFAQFFSEKQRLSELRAAFLREDVHHPGRDRRLLQGPDSGRESGVVGAGGAGVSCGDELGRRTGVERHRDVSELRIHASDDTPLMIRSSGPRRVRTNRRPISILVGMATLFYGASDVPIHIEDRALAHLKIVIATKLRRQESFTLSWRHPEGEPGGRSTIWIHPSIPLRFTFDEPEQPQLNPRWIDDLMQSVNSTGGILLVDEVIDAPVR